MLVLSAGVTWLGWLPDLSGWLPMMWTLAIAGIGAQVPHYYAHNETNNRLVHLLQAAGLFIKPRHHADHHRGNFDQNFCVFAGWHDWWLNRLVARRP